MTQDVVPDEFKVTIGEPERDGKPSTEEHFWFRLPGPRGLGQIGLRAAQLRRADAPGSTGTDIGLDPFTRDMYEGCAILETHLVRADALGNWPFSPDREGKPVVASDKFPAKAVKRVQEVREGFYKALDTFLD